MSRINIASNLEDLMSPLAFELSNGLAEIFFNVMKMKKSPKLIQQESLMLDALQKLEFANMLKGIAKGEGGDEESQQASSTPALTQLTELASKGDYKGITAAHTIQLSSPEALEAIIKLEWRDLRSAQEQPVNLSMLRRIILGGKPANYFPTVSNLTRFIALMPQAKTKTATSQQVQTAYPLEMLMTLTSSAYDLMAQANGTFTDVKATMERQFAATHERLDTMGQQNTGLTAEVSKMNEKNDKLQGLVVQLNDTVLDLTMNVSMQSTASSRKSTNPLRRLYAYFSSEKNLEHKIKALFMELSNTSRQIDASEEQTALTELFQQILLLPEAHDIEGFNAGLKTFQAENSALSAKLTGRDTNFFTPIRKLVEVPDKREYYKTVYNLINEHGEKILTAENQSTLKVKFKGLYKNAPQKPAPRKSGADSALRSATVLSVASNAQVPAEAQGQAHISVQHGSAAN